MGGFGQGDGWEGAWVTNLRDDGLRDSGWEWKKSRPCLLVRKNGFLQSTMLRREVGRETHGNPRTVATDDQLTVDAT